MLPRKIHLQETFFKKNIIDRMQKEYDFMSENVLKKWNPMMYFVVNNIRQEKMCIFYDA